MDTITVHLVTPAGDKLAPLVCLDGDSVHDLLARLRARAEDESVAHLALPGDIRAPLSQVGTLFEVGVEDGDELTVVYDPCRADGDIRSHPRDVGIVLDDIRCFPAALVSVPKDYLDNKKFVLDAVKANSLIFRFVSRRLRVDRDVVLAAVSANGRTLRCTKKFMRSDKNIVLAAVANSGDALWAASRDLRNDRDVVMAAVANSETVFVKLPQKFRHDKEVAMLAIQSHGAVYRNMCAELRRDADIVAALVASPYITSEHFLLSLAYQEVRDIKGVVVVAVKRLGSQLYFASERLRDDRDVVAAAVAQDGSALHYASDRLRDDPEIVCRAVMQNRSAEQYAGPNVQVSIRPHLK